MWVITGWRERGQRDLVSMPFGALGNSLLRPPSTFAIHARLTNPELVEPSRGERKPIAAVHARLRLLIGADRAEPVGEQRISAPHPRKRAARAPTFHFAERQLERHPQSD